MQQVLGFVGEKGSGKGTIIERLPPFYDRHTSVESVRFSEPGRNTLKQWGIPATRENLQNVVLAMSDHFGDDVLARAVRQLAYQSKAQVIVLDGMRWYCDVKMVRSFPRSLIVYVTAPLEVRFMRLKKRGENQGEAEMTFEQFMREEQAENEVFIPEIGKRADVTITNDGSIEDLSRKIDAFYKEHVAAHL